MRPQGRGFGFAAHQGSPRWAQVEVLHVGGSFGIRREQEGVKQPRPSPHCNYRQDIDSTNCAWPQFCSNDKAQVSLPLRPIL